ncbi:hypothetical protein CCACVL1_05246 [Corchorus capsularis]|uniref:Uncharacterized protein n=1 Tax=Corchorus capsularis TaxID=210143 RepID=A0A1R3JLP3_COCAP|nr:hypothetical protein CCACVL1_05246 [Corchorus capsularis]
MEGQRLFFLIFRSDHRNLHRDYHSPPSDSIQGHRRSSTELF